MTPEDLDIVEELINPLKRRIKQLEQQFEAIVEFVAERDKNRGKIVEDRHGEYFSETPKTKWTDFQREQLAERAVIRRRRV